MRTLLPLTIAIASAVITSTNGSTSTGLALAGHDGSLKRGLNHIPGLSLQGNNNDKNNDNANNGNANNDKVGEDEDKGNGGGNNNHAPSNGSDVDNEEDEPADNSSGNGNSNNENAGENGQDHGQGPETEHNPSENTDHGDGSNGNGEVKLHPTTAPSESKAIGDGSDVEIDVDEKDKDKNKDKKDEKDDNGNHNGEGKGNNDKEDEGEDESEAGLVPTMQPTEDRNPGNSGGKGNDKDDEDKENNGKDEDHKDEDNEKESENEKDDEDEDFGFYQFPTCRHAKTWSKINKQINDRDDDEGNHASKNDLHNYTSKAHVLLSSYQAPNGWKVEFAPNSSDVSQYVFPLYPALEERAEGNCFTDRSVGYLLTGSPIYSWASESAGKEINTTWHGVAHGGFEPLDGCLGHADEESYHHHGYSPCMAALLNDTVADGHSPLYGFAKDGYGIFGPYQGASLLARSCWVKRNYSGGMEVGGCEDGKRSCVLLNPMNVTEGVMMVEAMGPEFTDMIEGLDLRPLVAENGVFYEDYYFDHSCMIGNVRGAALDMYNGHSHGEIGYHYHLTIDTEDKPVFPYSVGPQFKGCLSSLSITACSSSLMSNLGINVAENMGESICGPQIQVIDDKCADDVYSLHKPTKSPTYVPRKDRGASKRPTFKPTTRITPLVKFASGLQLGGLTSPSLDAAARDAIINSTATVLKIKEEEVEIVSERATEVASSTSLRRRILLRTLATTYQIDVVLEVTLNAVDFTTSDTNMIYEEMKSSLESSVKSGALTNQIKQVASLFGADLLANVNVTGVTVSDASVVAPEPVNTGNSNDSEGLSDGAIAGIVIGGFVGVVAVIVILYFMFSAKSNGEHSKGESAAVVLSDEEKHASCPSEDQIITVHISDIEL